MSAAASPKATGAPQATAQGELAKTPFLHILLSLEDRKWEGSLVVWREPTGEAPRPPQDRFYFRSGQILKGRLVDSATDLAFAMLPMFHRATGAYAFYRDQDLVGTGVGVLEKLVDPWVVAAVSLRWPMRDDMVDKVLHNLGPGQLKLTDDANISRLSFLEGEEKVVAQFRQGASLESASRKSGVDAKTCQRLAYLLAMLKMLEAKNDASSSLPLPSAPPPSREGATKGLLKITGVWNQPVVEPEDTVDSNGFPNAPDGLSNEDRAFWDEVRNRQTSIENENYFEMLGVTRDAKPEGIRRAYFAIAKRWHSDRLTGSLLSLQPFCESIFSHFTNAHDTLMDEEKKVKYLNQLDGGGGTIAADRKLAFMITAAMDIQKAEILVKRRDFAGAVAILERALEHCPDDGDAYCFLGWSLFQQNQNAMVAGNPEYARVLWLSSKAIELSPNSDRNHYYRGLILRRGHDEAGAQQHFLRAVEINPKNLDAARETRLAKSRGDEKQPAAKSEAGEGSLFSRLLGRKGT